MSPSASRGMWLMGKCKGEVPAARRGRRKAPAPEGEGSSSQSISYFTPEELARHFLPKPDALMGAADLHNPVKIIFVPTASRTQGHRQAVELLPHSSLHLKTTF